MLFHSGDIGLILSRAFRSFKFDAGLQLRACWTLQILLEGTCKPLIRRHQQEEESDDDDDDSSDDDDDDDDESETIRDEAQKHLDDILLPDHELVHLLIAALDRFSSNVDDDVQGGQQHHHLRLQLQKHGLRALCCLASCPTSRENHHHGLLYAPTASAMKRFKTDLEIQTIGIKVILALAQLSERRKKESMPTSSASSSPCSPPFPAIEACQLIFQAISTVLPDIKHAKDRRQALHTLFILLSSDDHVDNGARRLLYAAHGQYACEALVISVLQDWQGKQGVAVGKEAIGYFCRYVYMLMQLEKNNGTYIHDLISQLSICLHTYIHTYLHTGYCYRPSQKRSLAIIKYLQQVLDYHAHDTIIQYYGWASIKALLCPPGLAGRGSTSATSPARATSSTTIFAQVPYNFDFEAEFDQYIVIAAGENGRNNDSSTDETLQGLSADGSNSRSIQGPVQKFEFGNGNQFEFGFGNGSHFTFGFAGSKIKEDQKQMRKMGSNSSSSVVIDDEEDMMMIDLPQVLVAMGCHEVLAKAMKYVMQEVAGGARDDDDDDDDSGPQQQQEVEEETRRRKKEGYRAHVVQLLSLVSLLAQDVENKNPWHLAVANVGEYVPILMDRYAEDRQVQIEVGR